MLQNFTSIFELLCAYNFVNAIEYGDSVLKYLYLTNPLKHSIVTSLTTIKEKARIAEEEFRSGIEKDTKNLLLISEVQKKVQITDAKVTNHGKVVPRQYLIAGLFCFFFLLFSAIYESYNKMNSFLLLIGVTVIAYILFSSFVRSKKLLPGNVKNWIIALPASLCIIYFILNIGGVINFHERNDHLLWIYVLSIIISTFFIYFSQSIVSRKFFMAIFIIIFFCITFFPKCTLAFDFFYDSNNNSYICSIEKQIVVALSSILIGLFPFLYDITFHSAVLFKQRRRMIALDAIILRSDIASKTTVNESDTSPFKEMM